MVLVAVGMAAVGVVCFPPAAGQAAGEGAPVYVTKIPPGYRDWKLVSVAHQEGETKDIRAILANDKGIKAFREAKLPFPEGTIIARIAWEHLPSDENNKAFNDFAKASADPQSINI